MKGYCVKEAKPVEIKNPKQEAQDSGRPVVRGKCPDCGEPVFRLGNLE